MTKIKESEIVCDPQVETTISEPQVQATTTPVQERDEFADSQYLDPDAKERGLNKV